MNIVENNNWVTAPDYHNALCDYCGTKAQYDAATKTGRWAFLCDNHFATETNQRLGLGLGQRLIPISEA